MDKMHVGMMGMPSEDSNNESSDGTVYEDKTVEENAVYKDENVDENVVSLLAPSLPPLLPCAIPQQQEQNNEELVATAAAVPKEMVEGDADGEVVDSDVTLVSVPDGAVGWPLMRSRASTLNLSTALKKAASSVKAQKYKPQRWDEGGFKQ